MTFIDTDVEQFEKVLQSLNVCGDAMAQKLARRGRTAEALEITQAVMNLRLLYAQRADAIKAALVPVYPASAAGGVPASAPMGRTVKSAKKVPRDEEEGYAFDK